MHSSCQISGLEEECPQELFLDGFWNYIENEGNVDLGALEAVMDTEETVIETLLNQWVQNAPPRNVPCSLDDLPDKKQVS